MFVLAEMSSSTTGTLATENKTYTASARTSFLITSSSNTITSNTTSYINVATPSLPTLSSIYSEIQTQNVISDSECQGKKSSFINLVLNIPLQVDIYIVHQIDLYVTEHPLISPTAVTLYLYYSVAIPHLG